MTFFGAGDIGGNEPTSPLASLFNSAPVAGLSECRHSGGEADNRDACHDRAAISRILARRRKSPYRPGEVGSLAPGPECADETRAMRLRQRFPRGRLPTWRSQATLLPGHSQHALRDQRPHRREPVTNFTSSVIDRVFAAR